ncbi:MAG: hypothetical protein KBT04_00170 [Bacteroidales bacterium]|nr:hypothetical protein [Candidatus Colimorpha onthohippi]
MNLEINIKQGLGDLHFDMPMNQIIAILGAASETETIENAVEGDTTILYYNDKGIALFCEGDEQLLVCVNCSNHETTLFGKQLFELSERQIVDMMVGHGYYEQDVADADDLDERRVSFGEGNVDFFFDTEGRLESVIIGK